MTTQTPQQFFDQFAKDRAIAPPLMNAAARLIEDTGRWEPREALDMEVKTQWQKYKPHDFGGALIGFYNADGTLWQAKPLSPRAIDGKTNKYETPKGNGSRAYLPAIDDATWAKISDKSGVPRDGATDFWAWVLAHPKVLIVLTEGAGKALALLSAGYVAIALTGCNGGYHGGSEKQGDKYVQVSAPRLIADLEPFAANGRQIVIAMDADTNPKTVKTVQGAISKFGGLLEDAGAIVRVAQWDGQGGKCKGVDDLIVTAGVSAWETACQKALGLRVWRLLTRQSGDDLSYVNPKGEAKLLSASKAAEVFAKEWGGEMAWNGITETFWGYSGGLWAEQPDTQIVQHLLSRIRRTGIGHGAEYVSGIIKLLRGLLFTQDWPEKTKFLPFKNGVLRLEDGEPLPHAPSYRFTWQLPYDYTAISECQPILEWLEFTQEGDADRVQLLRAALKAIVTGQVSLQRFLELLGPGGTGKSTFVNLAIALIGLSNVHSTSLKSLEENRFEGAQIYGKRLVYITDSEHYAGEVSKLKALTGGDPIPYEQKYKSAKSSFLPRAMVIMAANEAISSADNTSGLQRRRITIPFKRVVDPADRRELIKVTRDGISGEFAAHIPGLMRWVLDMPDAEVRRFMVDTARAVPGLDEARQDSLLSTNLLAAWLDANCVFAPGAKTGVGTATKVRKSTTDGGCAESWDTYARQNEWLYPNYLHYCGTAGIKNPVSVKRFSGLLLDLCAIQLKADVRKGRDNNGSACLEGIALRNAYNQDTPRPITGGHTESPVQQQSNPPAEAPAEASPEVAVSSVDAIDSAAIAVDNSGPVSIGDEVIIRAGQYNGGRFKVAGRLPDNTYRLQFRNRPDGKPSEFDAECILDRCMFERIRAQSNQHGRGAIGA